MGDARIAMPSVTDASIATVGDVSVESDIHIFIVGPLPPGSYHAIKIIDIRSREDGSDVDTEAYMNIVLCSSESISRKKFRKLAKSPVFLHKKASFHKVHQIPPSSQVPENTDWKEKVMKNENSNVQCVSTNIQQVEFL